MTNEEAIIYLERADTTVYKEIKTKTAEALEIAIKALEQTDKIEESNFSTEQYKADLQGAYDCGYAKALEQQTGWIPVSDPLNELPKDRMLYVTTEWGYVETLVWDMTEWDDADIARSTVAYMNHYEPQPYKAESEEEK